MFIINNQMNSTLLLRKRVPIFGEITFLCRHLFNIIELLVLNCEMLRSARADKDFYCYGVLNSADVQTLES